MLLITFGTRPEYIKVLPVIKELKKRSLEYRTFFTGQHTDLLSNIETPDHQITITKGGNRLDSIVQSILNNDQIFDGITCVLVQGDTTSAFATSLAAFHRQIAVCHLEAGLRTYDKNSPYPEEFNRRAISALADIHLSPTETATERLISEGYTKNVHTVGNTVLDNISHIKTSSGNTVIITLHRREKHNDMKEWFEALSQLALKNPELNFVFPIHPNPNVQKFRHLLQGIQVIDPLDHGQFMEYLSACKYIITDSGGIQEESAFLGKPCVVCRDFTERGEGLGTFSVLCKSVKELERCCNWANNAEIADQPCPYGDGNSATYICDIYEKFYKNLTNR